ncbi:MAG: carboxypeptidase-like regulatory domain-containing protein, partial [Chitinophagaceae bacterium]|nr:carboxypeptidase-like regulatory domain-containing protein [Chitinophagaceae bacterium]
AYLEKFLENYFYRTSLGSPFPIVELKYTKGFSGILNSSYDYKKLTASVSNYKKIPPLGSLYFNVFAGKTYGTIPYMFLDVAPGNEIYYYNRYAFNMMNKYEFIHDKYAGFNIEHNFGPGLFRFIPVTRKLKFRQLWTAKALWGSLSNENKTLNFVGDYPFQSLNGRTYLELGTGVDNVLKVLRLDFLWRVSPNQVSKYSTNNFGVFGSFRLAF